MLIQINTGKATTAQDLILVENFHLQIEALKKIIIFGADISSSVHIDNNTKDILILVEGPTQGLHNTSFTAEAKYPISFTQSRKIFVLSLHYNGGNSFLYVNVTKIHQFKSNNSEIKDQLIFQTILRFITMKNMIKRSCNFFLLILILFIMTIFQISLNIS